MYEEPDTRGPANLYVHHTILLPAFPLSVAWMDLAPGEVGRCLEGGRLGDWLGDMRHPHRGPS